MTLDPPVERLLEMMTSGGSGPVRAEDVAAMRESERRLVVSAALAARIDAAAPSSGEGGSPRKTAA